MLCSQAVSEVRQCRFREKQKMVDVAEESGGWGCHSPLPEIVRSRVRKLSWMCDSDRVV